jgi:hypothetical protein
MYYVIRAAFVILSIIVIGHALAACAPVASFIGAIK